MEQLVGDPAHRLQHLGAGGLVEVGQPGREPLHLGLDHRGRHRAQGHHGRGDAGLAAGGEERGDLLADDPAHALDLAAGLGVAQLVGEVGQADQGDAGQVADLGVDVVRQGEVDDRQRLAAGPGGLHGGAW